jgi:hypothetical protein
LKKANINAKIYPNKEFATKENLGNSIELPLHLKLRDKNKTVFIDVNTNKIYEDQWMVLNSVQKVSKQIVYSFNGNSNFADSVNYEKNFEKISFPTQNLEIVLYDFIFWYKQNRLLQ